MITPEQVAKLAAKATPAWRKRAHNGLPSFIESPKSGGMAYALEVFGEDYTGYGDDEQRERDLDFAAAAHYMAALIAQQSETIKRLEADAARYRWLTDGKRGDWVWNHVLTEEVKADHRDIDPAIDAAIQQQGGG